MQLWIAVVAIFALIQHEYATAYVADVADVVDTAEADIAYRYEANQSMTVSVGCNATSRLLHETFVTIKKCSLHAVSSNGKMYDAWEPSITQISTVQKVSPKVAQCDFEVQMPYSNFKLAFVCYMSIYARYYDEEMGIDEHYDKKFTTEEFKIKEPEEVASSIFDEITVAKIVASWIASFVIGILIAAKNDIKTFVKSQLSKLHLLSRSGNGRPQNYELCTTNHPPLQAPAAPTSSTSPKNLNTLDSASDNRKFLFYYTDRKRMLDIMSSMQLLPSSNLFDNADSVLAEGIHFTRITPDSPHTVILRYYSGAGLHSPSSAPLDRIEYYVRIPWFDLPNLKRVGRLGTAPDNRNTLVCQTSKPLDLYKVSAFFGRRGRTTAVTIADLQSKISSQP